MTTLGKPDLILSNVSVFPGETIEIAKADLVVRDGRIAEVAPPGSTAGRPAALRIEKEGLFVMPGLIDAHTHMLRWGSCGADEGLGWNNIRQIPMNFDVALSHGQTTVVDVGGPLHGAVALRRKLDATRASAPPLAVPPRFLVAGPILTAPNGYPFEWAPAKIARGFVCALELATPDEARRAVRRVREAGVDIVKVAAMEASYNEVPIPTIGDEMIRAVADEAHGLGLRVFVHAHSIDGYRKALLAGANVIAHSSFEALPDEIVARVAETSTIVIPTLWVFQALDDAHDDPGLFEEARSQLLPPLHARLAEFDRRLRACDDDLPPASQPHGEVLEGRRGGPRIRRRRAAWKGGFAAGGEAIHDTPQIPL